MAEPLLERLHGVGLSATMAAAFEGRRQHSHERLIEVRRRLRKLPFVTGYPTLAIYAAGSYARREGGVHSDIDLFFIHDDRSASSVVEGPRVKALTLMAGIVQELEDMEFPPPSNDGEYLNILSLSNILQHLGGAEDDHRNHFTARMLLLLESAPIFGTAAYNSTLDAVVDAYFRDYEDHAANFRPTFLVNDILRFWKTLCLNYENRRNQVEEARKIKQKIRNFKLGHSRLLTCFATIALLSNYNRISKARVVSLCKMTPVERLLTLHDQRPAIGGLVRAVLELYHWFLEKTALPTAELEEYFSDRNNRIEAFGHAKQFGDQIFDLVKATAEETGTFRYLVV
jgi:predicted nucleotidyltransferase